MHASEEERPPKKIRLGDYPEQSLTPEPSALLAPQVPLEAPQEEAPKLSIQEFKKLVNNPEITSNPFIRIIMVMSNLHFDAKIAFLERIKDTQTLKDVYNVTSGLLNGQKVYGGFRDILLTNQKIYEIKDALLYEACSRLAKKIKCSSDSLKDGSCQPATSQQNKDLQPFKKMQENKEKLKNWWDTRTDNLNWIYILDVYELFEKIYMHDARPDIILRKTYSFIMTGKINVSYTAIANLKPINYAQLTLLAQKAQNFNIFLSSLKEVFREKAGISLKGALGITLDMLNEPEGQLFSYASSEFPYNNGQYRLDILQSDDFTNLFFNPVPPIQAGAFIFYAIKRIKKNEDLLLVDSAPPFDKVVPFPCFIQGTEVIDSVIKYAQKLGISRVGIQQRVNCPSEFLIQKGFHEVPYKFQKSRYGRYTKNIKIFESTVPQAN